MNMNNIERIWDNLLKYSKLLTLSFKISWFNLDITLISVLSTTSFLVVQFMVCKNKIMVCWKWRSLGWCRRNSFPFQNRQSYFPNVSSLWQHALQDVFARLRSFKCIQLFLSKRFYLRSFQNTAFLILCFIIDWILKNVYHRHWFFLYVMNIVLINEVLVFISTWGSKINVFDNSSKCVDRVQKDKLQAWCKTILFVTKKIIVRSQITIVGIIIIDQVVAECIRWRTSDSRLRYIAFESTGLSEWLWSDGCSYTLLSINSLPRL